MCTKGLIFIFINLIFSCPSICFSFLPSVKFDYFLSPFHAGPNLSYKCTGIKRAIIWTNFKTIYSVFIFTFHFPKFVHNRFFYLLLFYNNCTEHSPPIIFYPYLCYRSNSDAIFRSDKKSNSIPAQPGQ